MKKIYIYIITSVLCISTILIIIPFYNTLPDQVPIQWDFAGNVNRVVSKNLFMFIFPTVGFVVNLINIYSLRNTNEKKLIKYYYIPVIFFLITFLVLYLAI